VNKLWIRDEFLLRSDKIFSSKHVDTSSYDKLKVKKPEKAYHSFLSSSLDNKFLHSTFISDLCVGKSDKWIRKYIYCYLEVKEGAVYPEFNDCLVNPFPIPDNWLRVFGFDKGYTDETCLCCGAIDLTKGICYVYDEYYEAQKPTTYHARRVKEKILGYNMYRPIQADPSVRNKNDRDGISYKDYFYNISGIYLDEANNDILNGIEIVRDMMYTGKLKIFLNCVNIKDESQKYLWKKDKDGMSKDDPTEKHNHLMDALRYMCTALPFDLRDISNTRTDDVQNLLSRMPNKTYETVEMTDGDGVYGVGYYNL